MPEPRHWRVRAALLLVALAVAGWAAAAVRSRVFAPLPAFAGRLEENFTDGRVASGAAVSSDGFEPCPDGLCLRPGVHGVFQYRVALPPSAHGMRIRMWGQLPRPGANRLRVSADGGRSFMTVVDNVQQTGAADLDVPLTFDPRVPAWLTIEATNGDANMAMPIDKLEIVFLTAPAMPMRGGLPVALLCGALAVAAAACSRVPASTLATGGILVLAIVLRFGQFDAALERPLDPDAQGYAAFAQQLRLFSDPGFYSGAFSKREPLWILVVHAWFGLVGPSASHLKLLTLALSAAVVWAMIRLAAALFGPAAGWFAGLMFALSGPLAFESSRGLRLELELLLLIGFLFATFVWRRPRGLEPRWAIVVGALGGLLLLTRSAYVSSVLPLMLGGAFYRRGARPFLHWTGVAVAAAAVAILCAAPHRYAFYQRYGNPFWDTASYARAIANTEFAGTAGFPTRAEIAVDGDMGPPLTFGQYLFTLHTPTEVARGTTAGLVELFRRQELCRTTAAAAPCAVASATLQLLALAGFCLTTVTRRRSLLWIPVTFLLLELPVAFLYDRNILELYRHTLQGFPLIVLGALVSIDAAVTAVRSRGRPAADACPA